MKILAVIDMQKDFLWEKRDPKFCYDTEKLVNEVNKAAAEYKSKGYDIIYIAQMFPNIITNKWIIGFSIKGTPGAEVIPELELYENTNEAERQHRLEIPAFGNYTSSFYLGENAVRTGSSIYDIVSRLYNSDFKFSLVSQGYAAGLFTADIYYNGRSSAPILVDGLDGDANVDGSTNLSDAVTVMQSIANPDKYNVSAQGSKNADTDGNGITNADALNIQKQLLGL